MTAPAGINITGEMYERPYAAYHEQSPVPDWFRHISPTYTGPTAIVYPGTLTLEEQSEVGRWLAANDFEKPSRLAQCTQRAAIAKITEYIAYYAAASYLNYRDANNSSRIAQWRLFLADAMIANKTTVPATGDPTSGTGTSAPTPPYDQATNLA